MGYGGPAAVRSMLAREMMYCRTNSASCLLSSPAKPSHAKIQEQTLADDLLESVVDRGAHEAQIGVAVTAGLVAVTRCAELVIQACRPPATAPRIAVIAGCGGMIVSRFGGSSRLAFPPKANTSILPTSKYSNRAPTATATYCVFPT